jgi:hypothetical protein
MPTPPLDAGLLSEDVAGTVSQTETGRELFARLSRTGGARANCAAARQCSARQSGCVCPSSELPAVGLPSLVSGSDAYLLVIDVPSSLLHSGAAFGSAAACGRWATPGSPLRL